MRSLADPAIAGEVVSAACPEQSCERACNPCLRGPGYAFIADVPGVERPEGA